jgi:hypothetical protein
MDRLPRRVGSRSGRGEAEGGDPESPLSV